MKKANKVILNGKVLIDLTQDTPTEEVVMKGIIYHEADGTISTGTAVLGKPITVATSAKMDEILANATVEDIGNCYKYTGETNASYETNALYVITQTE